jgi:hypothetical protein
LVVLKEKTRKENKDEDMYNGGKNEMENKVINALH